MTALDDKGRPVEVEPIPPTTGVDAWQARLADYPGAERPFGVDRSPAAMLNVWRSLDDAGLLGRTSRLAVWWYRARYWVASHVVWWLRIDPEDL